MVSKVWEWDVITQSLSLSAERYPSTISKEWVLTDTADSTQLATGQRLRAKLEKIQATRTAAAAGNRRREESDRRLREAESRARMAENRIREVEREKDVSEQRAATRIREAEGTYVCTLDTKIEKGVDKAT